MVFHSPHEGQRPIHFGLSLPQEVQNHAVLVLVAISSIYYVPVCRQRDFPGSGPRHIEAPGIIVYEKRWPLRSPPHCLFRPELFGDWSGRSSGLGGALASLTLSTALRFLGGALAFLTLATALSFLCLGSGLSLLCGVVATSGSSSHHGSNSQDHDNLLHNNE